MDGPMTHYGDPCLHCGIPHDEVASGPCGGNKTKTIPIAYDYLGCRWDGVEHYKILMSSGEIDDRWSHYSMDLAFDYLKDAEFRRPLQNAALGEKP